MVFPRTDKIYSKLLSAIIITIIIIITESQRARLTKSRINIAKTLMTAPVTDATMAALLWMSGLSCR